MAVQQQRQHDVTRAYSGWYVEAMEHLVSVVQELSHARDLASIAKIVREAARSLTGADGATFVLKDGDQCYYLEENAIAPLWKGQRFPMEACVSGWVMRHATPAVIEDIYQDARVPVDAYRPTFVKSLAMVPIRRDAPIGAIGNYWADKHRPSDEVMHLLQALADTASVALENAQLYAELQTKVKKLQESNYELSRFAWIASHDLQEPLRTIVTQVELLERRCGDKLDQRGINYIHGAVEGAGRLQRLIDDLLVHARAEKIENFRPVALDSIMDSVMKDLGKLVREHDAVITVGELPWVWGDQALLCRLLQNLLANAIKFHREDAVPEIHVECHGDGKEWICSVSDNGIGIDPKYHQRIFGLFQRLHPQDVYPGTGIGLATCKKIVELHGGRLWVESVPGEGSRFSFTLPAPQDVQQSMQSITRGNA